MESVTAIARRPAAAIAARAAGDALPRYVTRDQARKIVNAAQTTTHRLLLETIWQSGGRISEVLRLRPCDVDDDEGALHLRNLKQRRATARKLTYVSRDLVAQLRALAVDARVPWDGYYFRSRQSHRRARPMHRSQAWRIIGAASIRAGVLLVDVSGTLRPAAARDFRHGAAVNQIRQGVPVSEVQQQLGHARLDTTAIYLRLANPERRATADGVVW